MNTPYQSADRRRGSMLMATLLTAASTILLAAPPRLVGQPIGNDEAIEAAFKKAVECEAPAGDPVRYQGTLGGASFKFVAVNCAFIGGNALWAAFMVGFHDGKRLTRVMAFKGGLSVESAVGVRGDRIVYEAKVSKPNDARCCRQARWSSRSIPASWSRSPSRLGSPPSSIRFAGGC